MRVENPGARTRTSRVIRDRPEELYEGFTDPTVLVTWLPPGEMTGQIHEFDRGSVADPGCRSEQLAFRYE